MLCGLNKIISLLFNTSQSTFFKNEGDTDRKEHRGIIQDVREHSMDQSRSEFECPTNVPADSSLINSYHIKMMDGFEVELNCTKEEFQETKDILSPRKLVQIIYYWPEGLELPYAIEIHPLIQDDFQIMTWREVLDTHNFEYDAPLKVSKKGPLRLEFLQNPETYTQA